jgi:hypothetical protein
MSAPARAPLAAVPAAAANRSGAHARTSVKRVRTRDGIEPTRAPTASERAPSPTVRAHHDAVLKEHVSWDLSGMRAEREFDEPDCDALKVAAQGWHERALEGAANDLQGLLLPGVTDKQVQDALRKDIFKGLETRTKEETEIKRTVPYLEPRVTKVRGHELVSFDVAALLIRKLQYDKQFRQKILETSEYYKSGAMHRRVPELQKSLMDGAKVRYHPEMLRKARPGEGKHVRVGLIYDSDDVEVLPPFPPSSPSLRLRLLSAPLIPVFLPCVLFGQAVKNAIGTARGKHKQLVMQMGVANLPAEERFKRENILLIGCARASAYKQLGMARVVCGVDKNGVDHGEPCHARDMRRLHEGVRAWIPDDVNGGMMEIELHAYDLLPAGDWLGRMAMVPFLESPSAHMCCGKCLYDTRHPLAGRPYSHHRQLCTECEPFHLRSDDTLRAQVEAIKGCKTKADAERICADYGIKHEKVHSYTWNSEYIPFVCTTDIPEDGLHLFGDGLLRSEGAWMINDLCKGGGLLFATLVDALTDYDGLPPDVRIPNLHPKLLECAAGGLPKSDSVLRMTGSQVHHFALHRCKEPAMRAQGLFHRL